MNRNQFGQVSLANAKTVDKSQEHKQLILIGDINSDYVKTPLDIHTRTLQFISSVYQLEQLMKEPTQVTKSSATTIDLIFTNMVDKIATSGVIHLGISDHSLI